MIAFKEWTLICDALARGEQSLIIRKGGIAEGRDGFRFKHPDFLFFPTLFHEQAAKLRVPADTALPALREDGQHEIRLAAHVEWTEDLTDWEKIKALAPLHLWQESEIEKRFRQDEKFMVSLAFLRVQKLSEPLLFPDAARYGGCRSWVEVPELTAGTSLIDVLDETTHRKREASVRAVIGG